MFSKDQRVVARIRKNRWYVGTVTRVFKASVNVIFDDGSTAKVEAGDYNDLLPIIDTHVFKRPIDDETARQLHREAKEALKSKQQRTHEAVKRIAMLPPADIDLRIKPKNILVFIPPPSLQSYAATFKQMCDWVDRIALRYKFAPKQVFKNKKLGSVAVSRTFTEPGDTMEKYRRAVQLLQKSFAASTLWRAQVFAGSNQFFSNNGVFHAAFYDIADPSSSSPGARKIGFYINTAVG